MVTRCKIIKSCTKNVRIRKYRNRSRFYKTQYRFHSQCTWGYFASTKQERIFRKTMLTSKKEQIFFFSFSCQRSSTNGRLSLQNTYIWLSAKDTANKERESISSEWVTEPELSWTDRREGHYQATVTEVLHRVESLLTQAHQTFSWTGVSACPVAKSWEGLRDRDKDWENESERVNGAVRGAESL